MKHIAALLKCLILVVALGGLIQPVAGASIKPRPLAAAWQQVIAPQGSGYQLSGAGWTVISAQNSVYCSVDSSKVKYTQTRSPGSSDDRDWAKWGPSFPQTGWYQVYIYIPDYGHSRAVTASARYTVFHANGSNQIVLDQNQNKCNWVYLGTYRFLAGGSGYVYMGDYTGGENPYRLIAADGAMFVSTAANPQLASGLVVSPNGQLVQNPVNATFSVTNYQAGESMSLGMRTLATLGGTTVNFGETSCTLPAEGDCGYNQTTSFSTPGIYNVCAQISRNGAAWENFSCQNISILNPTSTLTNISPNNVYAGGADFSLQVTGINFINGSVVTWDGVNLTTTFVSASHLTATVPASLIQTAGSATIQVSTPAPGGGLSNGASFAILDPMPVVTSMDPLHGPNDRVVFLNIVGTNFIATPSVTIGSTPALSVTLQDASHLQARVPAEMAAGEYNVKVCNPTGSCAAHEEVYTVDSGHPVIFRITPTYGLQSVPNEITVVGENFLPGIHLEMNHTALTDVTFLTGHQLRAVVPAGMREGVYDLLAWNEGMEASPFTLPKAYQVINPLKDDFAIDAANIWASPAAIHLNDVVTLGANVRRLGGTLARQVQVNFYRVDPVVGEVLLGSTLSPSMPPDVGISSQVSIQWNTQGLAVGSHEILVRIDPDQQIVESNELNNQGQRFLQILPANADQIPPVVIYVKLNNGANFTSLPSLSVQVTVTDSGGSGVAAVMLVEREFDSSSKSWSTSQTSGWLPYPGPFAFELTDRGGVHYVQVWAKDGAGNISLNDQMVRIDLLTTSVSVGANQAVIYRQTLARDQNFTVKVDVTAGDADVYIWNDDGSRLWVGRTDGQADEEVSFVVPKAGVYQIEVWGYTAAKYSLSYAGSVTDQVGLQPNSAKPAHGLPVIATTHDPEHFMALPAIPLTGPVIVDVDPPEVAPHALDFALTLSGMNFKPYSIVQWNGEKIEFTYVNENTIVIQMSLASLNPVLNNIFTVVTPDEDLVSNPALFCVVTRSYIPFVAK